LLSSGDSFPHLIQKSNSQLGFVTYLLNCPRIKRDVKMLFKRLSVSIRAPLGERGGDSLAGTFERLG
jgi:hypothetical protein